MRERDAALGRLAERQFGAFTALQAIDCGFPRSTVHDRVRSGAWVRVVGRCYRVAGAVPAWQQTVVGAALAAGDPAAVSGRGALALWDLADPPACEPEVTVPWSRRPVVAGVRVVRTRRWTREDVVRHGPVLVTTVSRTLLDVASVVPDELLEMAVDRAHRKGALDLRRCAPYLRRASVAKIPGASKLGRMLALRDPDRPLESEAETLLLRTLRRARLPMPVPQYRVRTRNGTRRLDFAYPEHRVGIEVDGWSVHAGRTAFEDDRARDNDLADVGWSLRHLTWAMMRERPLDVVWTIAGALGLEPARWRATEPGRDVHA